VSYDPFFSKALFLLSMTLTLSSEPSQPGIPGVEALD
jgi:hypothetical protein